jgi:hypothetical protein
MQLQNFNQEIATQFVGAYSEFSEVAARQLFQELKADAGLPMGPICSKDGCNCSEFCGCDDICYNDVIGAAYKLSDLLNQIRVASVNLAYSSLIPSFFCIAEKALTIEPEEKHGNIDSESESEQSSEEGTSW